MCGIAGFYNDQINREQTIKLMSDRMLHRGPDSGGYWLDNESGWTIGHRRLSIVDLSNAGAQPMSSASGRYIISYNGEIYNCESVKKRLGNDGLNVRYRGTSDTEVLVEAIEAYGIEQAVSHCKGMFAVAAYDRKEKVLYLARDRVGEKPLYYGFIQGKGYKPYFAFASDISLLKMMPQFENEIDRDALAEYMLYGYIAAPKTIYKGIYKLLPGAILRLDYPYDTPNVYKYWSMEEMANRGFDNQFIGSEEEASEELERLLSKSISGQMISDVPLGAFLSGGIDSTTIVALMQNISDKPVKTFTIGFDDDAYNEATYAKDISNYLGTDHTEVIISESEMQAIIPKLPYYFSEPFGDSSMIPTYLVSKIAKEKVTVSLSGDAGDELFCGYDGYWKTESFWRKVRSIPPIIRNMGKGILEPFDVISYRNIHRLIGVLQSNNICQLKDVVFNRKNSCFENIVLGGKALALASIDSYRDNSFMDIELYDMMKYHPDDILTKVDRAGMAVSLENRIPMLDKDVLEFTWRIPEKYKYSNGVSKRVLRNILYKYVPQEMIDRPKQGFVIPMKKWLKMGETSLWAEELIQNSYMVRDGFLNGKTVKYVWENHDKSQSMLTLTWNILMAEQWYRMYEG